MPASFIEMVIIKLPAGADVRGTIYTRAITPKKSLRRNGLGAHALLCGEMHQTLLVVIGVHLDHWIVVGEGNGVAGGGIGQMHTAPALHCGRRILCGQSNHQGLGEVCTVIIQLIAQGSQKDRSASTADALMVARSSHYLHGW